MLYRVAWLIAPNQRYNSRTSASVQAACALDTAYPFIAALIASSPVPDFAALMIYASFSASFYAAAIMPSMVFSGTTMALWRSAWINVRPGRIHSHRTG